MWCPPPQQRPWIPTLQGAPQFQKKQHTKGGMVDGGMGSAAFSRAKKEKIKAGKDTLTDGAPHPLWELAELRLNVHFYWALSEGLMNFARLKGNPASCCNSTWAISAFVYFTGSVLKKTNRLGCRSFDSISFRATARRFDAFSMWLARKKWKYLSFFFHENIIKYWANFPRLAFEKKMWLHKCNFFYLYLLTYALNKRLVLSGITCF